MPWNQCMHQVRACLCATAFHHLCHCNFAPDAKAVEWMNKVEKKNYKKYLSRVRVCILYYYLHHLHFTHSFIHTADAGPVGSVYVGRFLKTRVWYIIIQLSGRFSEWNIVVAQQCYYLHINRWFNYPYYVIMNILHARASEITWVWGDLCPDFVTLALNCLVWRF